MELCNLQRELKNDAARNGLPREVVARLHAANRKALADPKIAQRLAELGVQGRDMTPEQFSAFVAAQVKDWYQPVRDSGARLN